MASELYLSVKKNLDWKTKLPSIRTSVRYESPIFIYMKQRLKIVFGVQDERYFIVLINCDGTHDFSAFSLSTHLQLKERGTVLQCSNITIRKGFEFLYFEKKDVVDRALNISIHTKSTDVTVACIFHPSTICINFIGRNHLNLNEDNSSQLTVDGCKTQKKRKLTKDDSTIKPSESSLKALPHLESLSMDFGDMLQKKILTDVELKCGEVSIPAHKAVLMSRSMVFSSMFEHEMVETITGSVEIKDIEPSVLQEFLKYLYSGKISEDMSSEVILELYNASDKYAVQSLQKGCRNMMVSNLTEQNCIEILTLGEKHCDQQLKDVVADFIIKRPSVLKSDAWMEFSDNFPKLSNTIFRKYVLETS